MILVRNKHEEGKKISIQNTTEEKIKIGKDTKAVEVKIREQQKETNIKSWEEFKERDKVNTDKTDKVLLDWTQNQYI